MAAADPVPPESGDDPLHAPYWVTPGLYGEAEALNSMGTIAAPLLAGFSLAAVVLVLTVQATEARWPDVALLLFLLAAVFFVTSVQAMFWARGYQASPQEIQDWWPDAADPDRLQLLRREQKRHAAGFRMWSNRARVTYSAALLCLLAALTILAVPPDSQGQAPVWRWLAVAVGAAAFMMETAWVTGSLTDSRWARRLLEPPPATWQE
jgi:hypothetical protein